MQKASGIVRDGAVEISTRVIAGQLGLANVADGTNVEVVVFTGPFRTQRLNGSLWEDVTTDHPSSSDARMQFADSGKFPDPLGCRVTDSAGAVVFQ